MDDPGRDTFAAHLESQLAVVSAGDPLPLRVDAVEDYGDADGSRFSVFLSGPADRPLHQGLHTLRPDGDDAFEVFLVPVGREGDRLVYEAAYNREGGA